MFPNLMKLISRQSSFRSAQLLRFNSELAGQIRPRPKEIQSIKLSGTILREPLNLKDGAKMVLVKTVKPDNFYCTHSAFIRGSKLLNLIGDELAVGQRVFLSGKLSVNPFKNGEGKFRSAININVDELYATKLDPNAKDEGSSVLDYNDAMILSRIVSEITHMDDFSIFLLALHHTPKNSSVEKTNFVRVYAHDPTLVQMLKTKLTKGDRVIVKGLLNSKSEVDAEGKKKLAGYLEALSIMKVDRFQESRNLDVPNDEENAAAN